DRVGAHLDAALREQVAEDEVLAAAEPYDGLRVGRIGRCAFGQRDATRGEEGADAIRAGAAVHVGAVIRIGERPERLAGGLRARAYELVEEPSPRLRVDARSECHDAVEVEDGGFGCRPHLASSGSVYGGFGG